MNLVDGLVRFSIGNGPGRALASRLLSWLLAPGDRPARIAEEIGNQDSRANSSCHELLVGDEMIERTCADGEQVGSLSPSDE
jgi:hypothetical protein